MTKAGKEAGRWLKQAEEDLKYAKILFAAQGWYMVCFLAHQVVEKALKAFLYAQGEVRVIGQSVLKLLQRTIKYDAAFKVLRRAVKPLEGYYVEARYPNTVSEEYIPAEFFERREAEFALVAAGKTLKLVKRKLERGAGKRESKT